MPDLPRQRQPEMEYAYARPPSLGYESQETAGFVRCLAHGFPTPLARWHCHDEYELHLITATSGKAFVGDWIGPFQAGHLVLCGPRLPHNWISAGVPPAGVDERDLVIQFAHEPIARAAELMPELADLMPMLQRASHGIEFFGMGERAEAAWRRIKGAHGAQRLAAFLDLLADLAASTDYRLLSNVQMRGEDGSKDGERINAIVDRLTEDIATPVSAAELAAGLGMSESQFSRFFRRATGNSFTDFVTRIRINRACQLLMETDKLVNHIGLEVGFQNLANFNRRFRDVKGMTPSAFRRQAAQRFSHGG